MTLRRLRLTRVAIVGLSAIGFAAAADFLFGRVVDAQNRAQLTELTNNVLERAERSVDYAFIALGDLAETGATTCSADTLSEIRRQVYQRSTVKDIRIVDQTGRVICSAFPETLEFDAKGTMQADKLPARNPAVQLFRVAQKSGVALGLCWEIDKHTMLVAVINTEAMLFDMLPGSLRDATSVQLKLANGESIASFVPGGGQMPDTSLVFASSSQQYPLAANLIIDPTIFADWNKGHRFLVIGAAGVLGLIFGFLFAKLIGRPRNPVTDLDEALARKEFKAYLQPIFSLQTGTIVGCEALARWQRSDGVVVQPAQFIPLAEASGRIVPLTWQIVSNALTELRPVLRRDKNFKVSFNVVPDHFMSPGFADDFKKHILEANVSPRQVVIELTERQEILDLDGAAKVIAELRDFGLKVAIDDAGTGHSGLSYVQKLGVNTLKIDKFFIDSIGRDQSTKPVVEMLVRLARELNMTTVAEGIETEDQLAVLQACGVDEGQGYCVSPPLPIPAFVQLLQKYTLELQNETQANAKTDSVQAA